MKLEQQIEKFEKTDLSQIENRLVRSKFYEFFADILKLIEVQLDCDSDAILLKLEAINGIAKPIE